MAFSGGCAWLAKHGVLASRGRQQRGGKGIPRALANGHGQRGAHRGLPSEHPGRCRRVQERGINLQPIDRDGTYHQTWSGGAMLGRSCQVVEDSSAIDTSAGGGGRLGAALATAVPEAGATVLTKTAATRPCHSARRPPTPPAGSRHRCRGFQRKRDTHQSEQGRDPRHRRVRVERRLCQKLSPRAGSPRSSSVMAWKHRRRAHHGPIRRSETQPHGPLLRHDVLHSPCRVRSSA